MATAFSEVITKHFLTNVDDIRIQEDLAKNPAATMRRLSVFLENAIPLFNRPVSMMRYLSYTKPDYNDCEYIPEEEAQDMVVHTDMLGFELCSTGQAGIDIYQNPFYKPVENEYDPETGDVILKTDAKAGDVFQIDFYTDGTFEVELSATIQRILGMCAHFVWESRFTGEWLSRTPTIQDKTFKKGSSESAWTIAQTQRLKEVYTQLCAEMSRYEQTVAYSRQMFGVLPI